MKLRKIHTLKRMQRKTQKRMKIEIENNWACIDYVYINKLASVFIGFTYLINKLKHKL